MSERLIFMAKEMYGSPAIVVYRVLKETPRLYRVEGLTNGAWDRQIFKDDVRIRSTIYEARSDLREILRHREERQEQELRETRAALEKVEETEPQWNAKAKALVEGLI